MLKATHQIGPTIRVVVVVAFPVGCYRVPLECSDEAVFLARERGVMRIRVRRFTSASVILACLVALVSFADRAASAQSLGGAGTVRGIVKDPTGGVMQAVEVRISNPVTGLARTATTDAAADAKEPTVLA